MEDFWNNRWEEGRTNWHLNDVNEILLRNFDKHCPKVIGQVRVFVPLCGKTVDMKWLVEKGCEVIGVELNKKACEDFFNEQKLDYDLLTAEGIPTYQAKNCRLTIYNCNFFLFASQINIGKFHFIWDRGSLVIMDEEEKPRYVALMKKWLYDDFAYLIEAPLYSTNEYKGFPQPIEFQELIELYSDHCDLLTLDKIEFLEKAKKKFTSDLTSFFWCAYILLPKSF